MEFVGQRLRSCGRERNGGRTVSRFTGKIWAFDCGSTRGIGSTDVRLRDAD